MASKIALQMACKIGKSLWKIERPVLMSKKEDKTMITGIDFYKKSIRINQKVKHCVGIVSTLNSDCTEFNSMAVFPDKQNDEQ